MEKRKFDKLGIETSLLGFGCMRFPTTAEGKIDEEEAERMIDRAISQGVNYIDTAYPYHNGQSEIVVGKILKKYPRDSFYLATKLPCWEVHTTEDISRLFYQQLDKLQTDYIDFYLMHALNRERFDEMVSYGCLEELEKLRAQGKIKYIGFSFHDSYEAFEYILKYREWDFSQIQLNYMDADEQAGLKGYNLAEKMNIPLIIMEPVKGGSLASFSNDIIRMFNKLDFSASPASYALRWVGSLTNVKVILSGMSTMGQVEDNLKTFNAFKALTDMERETITQVTEILNNRVKNGCTGCRYCMPCPAGVNIPYSFNVWNKYHMYQNYDYIKRQWESEIGDEHQPKNCIGCGKCEAACPQKLSIREDLKRAQSDLNNKIF